VVVRKAPSYENFSQSKKSTESGVERFLITSVYQMFVVYVLQLPAHTTSGICEPTIIYEIQKTDDTAKSNTQR
jgi:hypothetical protein